MYFYKLLELRLTIILGILLAYFMLIRPSFIGKHSKITFTIFVKLFFGKWDLGPFKRKKHQNFCFLGMKHKESNRLGTWYGCIEKKGLLSLT